MQADIRDKLWAHVHGELSAADRQAVDAALEADGVLKAEWLRLRALDRQLREAMRPDASSTEALTDALLAEWDRTHGTATAKAAGGVRHRPVIVTLRNWSAVLALAAGLVLMFGVPSMVLSPLDWNRTDVVPLQVRGDSAPVPDAAAFKAMESLSDSLRSRVAARYAQRAPSRWNLAARWKARHAWVLDRRFQPMAGEAFSVSVAARRPGDPEAAHEWQWYFQSSGSFQAQMDTLADAIVEDLHLLQEGVPPAPKAVTPP